jgi:hypothetical protein
VSFSTYATSAQPARPARPAPGARVDLDRQVGAGEVDAGDVGDAADGAARTSARLPVRPPSCRARPPPGARSAPRAAGEQVEPPVAPSRCGDELGPRTWASRAPSGRRGRRRSCCCRRRRPARPAHSADPSRAPPTAGTPRSRPAAGRSARREVELTDERVREQRLLDAVPAAVDRGVQGEVLVRGDVADQPGEERVDGRDRQRAGPPAPITAGTSTTASSGRNGSVPSLRTLTTWTSPPVAEQRGHQVDGGLGVVGAAALLEQAGLVSTAGSAYIASSWPRSRRPRPPASRGSAARPPPRRAGRSSAGSTTAPRPARAAGQRHLDLSVGQLVAVLASSSGRTVRPVDRHLPPDPGQVVEPDVVELTSAGVTPSSSANAPLEADRHVAQPDGPVPGLSSARVTMPTGLVKSTIQASGAPAAGPLGDVEHDGDGAQRLREAAGPGRLLPDAAALERPGLVAVARRLPADPQLQQHDVGPVHARVDVAGRGDPGRVAGAGQHPPGHAADQLEAAGVRVDEHELVDRQLVAQPGEPVDQLGGVRRAAADRSRSVLIVGGEDAFATVGHREGHRAGEDGVAGYGADRDPRPQR